jgi:hypothetical protein
MSWRVTGHAARCCSCPACCARSSPAPRMASNSLPASLEEWLRGDSFRGACCTLVFDWCLTVPFSEGCALDVQEPKVDQLEQGHLIAPHRHILPMSNTVRGTPDTCSRFNLAKREMVFSRGTRKSLSQASRRRRRDVILQPIFPARDLLNRRNCLRGGDWAPDER